MGRNQEPVPNFAESLRALVAPLCKLQPSKINMVHVRASYGNYKITLGQNTEQDPSVEIDGEIHHLFLTPGRIAPNPTNLQIEKNMKDTVIMRDLSVHLLNPDGQAEEQNDAAEKGNHSVEAREMINLAGERGEELIQEAVASGKLSKAAYEIIRHDILTALTDHPEDSLGEVSEF
ncbi:MAG: hypothetical protein A3I05_08150 [Deltaproteobacteria bacterium RIFCSPLOWO2_02_FULL_44_10]|nr:MAG: hypothetical protein A3C46_05035 [Deltaproteobacteria bacterium RIFCSPHIGHO2_02_FULL_44_16]OGQ45931.1 MAG: hypothetical protein A3I05_08150 [Deltaproteobacteria bacterium RIFCSPLOWO2_02_FULL_44_10]